MIGNHDQLKAFKYLLVAFVVSINVCVLAVILETANLPEALPGWLKYLAQNLWTWIKWLWGGGAFLISIVSIINLIRNHVKRRKEKAHNS